MLKFPVKFLGWIAKNIGLVIGIVEQILKVLAGIASLTPTRKDDTIVNWLEKLFDKIKTPLYKFGEWAGNFK